MAAPSADWFDRSQRTLDALRSQVQRVEVEIVSPDGSVKVSMSRRKGVAVELLQGVARHRNEGSLARQAGHALSDALSAYAERIVEIADAEFRNRHGQPGSDAGADRFDAEVARIRGTGISPTEQVTAARTGTGPVEIELNIRDGALRDLPRELLAEEIAAAVARANRAYQATHASLYSKLRMERIWRAAADFDADQRRASE